MRPVIPFYSILFYSIPRHKRLAVVTPIIPTTLKNIQPVREAVSYRGLFTAGWFGVREKHSSRLEIYDRLRASEQAGCILKV